MSPNTGVREAQRRRTRRALLDAALDQLEERSLGTLGLREVAWHAGIAPTAFYRHCRAPGTTCPAERFAVPYPG